MSQSAIQKLQAEMTKSTDDPYVQLIGQFLIDHVNKNPQDAEKLAVADKTILKSLDAMTAAAKAKQKNGRAMLSDAEGFAIVLKYFGIEGQAQAAATIASKKIELDDLF